MKRIAAIALILVAGCSASPSMVAPPKASAPMVKPETTAPATTATKADPIAAFEADNAIPSSDWYAYITGREVKYSNSLWVYTKLHADSDAKHIAASMCGAYSQYVLVDAKVRTTFVRASDGTQIAKCGPGV